MAFRFLSKVIFKNLHFFVIALFPIAGIPPHKPCAAGFTAPWSCFCVFPQNLRTIQCKTDFSKKRKKGRPQNYRVRLKREAVKRGRRQLLFQEYYNFMGVPNILGYALPNFLQSFMGDLAHGRGSGPKRHPV